MSRAAVFATAATVLAAAGPADATRLFGLVDTGELFASNDAGVTWQAYTTLPVPDVVALAAGETSAELFLASRSGIVYVSNDAGLSWSATATVPASDVVDAALRPDGALILLTATGSVYESVDQGASFSAIATLPAPSLAALTFTPPGYLHALSRTGEVYESGDGGDSWSAVGAMPVSDAVAIEALGPALFALDGTGDVRTSSDGGVSWSAVGTLSQVGMTDLRRAGGELLAVTREGHVAASPDGVAWSWRGSINQLRVVALGTDTPATDVAIGPIRAGALSLATPRPNPQRIGQGSTFAVSVNSPTHVEFFLHDVAGRLVARGPREFFPAAGTFTVGWDPGLLPAGVYTVRLVTESGARATTLWVLLN